MPGASVRLATRPHPLPPALHPSLLLCAGVGVAGDVRLTIHRYPLPAVLRSFARTRVREVHTSVLVEVQRVERAVRLCQ